MTATGNLVDLVCGTTFDDLGPGAVAAARRILLDNLGCIVAGHGFPSAQIVRQVIGGAGGPGGATVLVGGERTGAATAAYVNAHASNVIDADDVFRYRGHLGSATVAPALAVAEERGRSGRDLLTAIAVGYEVAARIGLSLQGFRMGADSTLKFAPVSGYSWVGYSATTAAGWLLGLGTRQLMHAFGVAGSTLPMPASTPYGRSLPRPMSKYVMYGTVSATGVTAAQLAEAGFTGEPDIFDGDRGLWRTLHSEWCDWEWLDGRPDGRWLIEDVCFKPYPAYSFNLPAIELMMDLVAEHGLDPARIEAIEVQVPGQGMTKHRIDDPRVRSTADASFSLPHLLAAAAFQPSPGPGWLTRETAADPRVRELAGRVSVTPHPEAGDMARADLEKRGHLARIPTTLTVRAGGRSFTAGAYYAKGDIYDPGKALSQDELEGKFRALCAGTLAPDRIDAVIATVEHIDEAKDLGPLVGSLVVSEHRPAEGVVH